MLPSQLLLYPALAGAELIHALLQMVDMGAFHLGQFRGGGGLPVEFLPLGLPGLELGFDGIHLHQGLRQRRSGRRVLGSVFGQGRVELRHGVLVAGEQIPDLGELALQAVALALLASAALLGKPDALFEARDLGTDGIVAPLDRVERVRGPDIAVAQLLAIRLQLPLARDLALQRRLPDPQGLVLGAELPVEGAPAQGPQLRLQPPLVLLEALVLLGGSGLPFQVREVLGDLLAQVIQALQVVAGVTHPVFRLAPPFLVLGDARRLLQKQAQLLRPGLDEPRDDALLDDGVTART